MSSARLLRPLARSLHQPILRTAGARSTAAAAFSTKSKLAPFTPSVSAQIEEYGQIRKDGKLQRAQQANATANANNSVILKAAMPQLVPFYFMNEVTFAFILLPSLIWVLSKYVLPKVVRTRAARLFISKL